MKFLYIANIRLPTEKAHGVQIMRMCEAFADVGNVVTLLVTNRKTQINTELFSYYGVRPVFTIARGTSWDLVSLGKIGFAIQSFTFALSAQASILRLRPDIIYTRDPLVVIGAWLCGSRNIVWEVHTAQATMLSNMAASHATKVVCISQGLNDFLITKNVSAEKIIVEHDGVDLAEFAAVPSKQACREALSIPQDTKVVEYVGKLKTMGESKGVEGILTALGEVKKHIPNILFLLVGLNDDEVSSAKTEIEAAGLIPVEYRLVTHVPHTEVPKYLHAGDALIMNYPNAPHFARMMSPLKLFEYMASGTTIVTSDLPTIREILTEEEAIFVEPDNAASLAQGIIQALIPSEEVTKLAVHALQKVASYTWRERAERITTFITSSFQRKGHT